MPPSPHPHPRTLHPHPPTKRAPIPHLAGLLVLAMGAVPSAAAAEDSVFDSWARWASYNGPWKGATVMVPEPEPRPASTGYRLDSTFEAVSVHAPAAFDPTRAARALAAAEDTLGALRARGWPLPAPDGGRGGTPGLDVYLDLGAPGARAGFDVEDGTSLYDGGVGYARVDAWAPTLEACVASGVAQAALLSADAAEAPAWRIATGTLFAWWQTGDLGCAGDGMGLLDRPEHGLGHATSDEESALFLAMLSERVDGGSGSFLRDMWYFAQQDSGDTRFMLRASPDLWEATERALDNAGQSLDDLIVDLAVARYFTGARRGRGTGFRVLDELGRNAAVAIEAEVDGGRLPRHLTPERGLWPLGSAYTLVRVPTTREGDQLQVWLRGELGPRWSLAVVQLDGEGHEIGRLIAPARRTPRSYLPVFLSERAESVLLVVTRLPKTLPDADTPTPPPAHYKLIIGAESAGANG